MFMAFICVSFNALYGTWFDAYRQSLQGHPQLTRMTLEILVKGDKTNESIEPFVLETGLMGCLSICADSCRLDSIHTS
jgi:hypothetical protein